MIADLMAALWEVFLFCKCKVSDYSLAFCFYMEFLALEIPTHQKPTTLSC